MEYRILGRTGLEVSILGYGCMRLPILHGDMKNVGEALAVESIRYAVDNGLNFVDTAYIYHGGNSEIVLGKALRDGYREKVYLMDKSPTWNIEEPGDYDKYLDEQLTRLGVDYLDLYLFHGLNAKSFEGKIKGLGLYECALRARDAGKIRFIGWSFHDKPEELKPMVDAGIGDAVLIQYNMLDRSNEEVIGYAAENGVAVMVMGPVGGGRLVSPPPEVVESMEREGQTPLSPELALRFVFSNPNVTLALSGMSTMEQVVSNVGIANNFVPLSPADLQEVINVVDQYKAATDLYCTGCNYCMPCPNEVNIPLNFSMMNYYRVFHAYNYARQYYNLIGIFDFLPGKPASECIQCGECEPKCPQNIPIMKQLGETAELLGGG